MDYEVVYNVFGVAIFLFIAYKVFKSQVGSEIQTKEEKRKEIVDGYKKQLKDALEPLKDDKDKRILKKQQLLKVFTEELSRNIFFDADENREIISELSMM